jgi:hypothetical protein
MLSFKKGRRTIKELLKNRRISILRRVQREKPIALRIHRYSTYLLPASLPATMIVEDSSLVEQGVVVRTVGFHHDPRG